MRRALLILGVTIGLLHGVVVLSAPAVTSAASTTTTTLKTVPASDGLPLVCEARGQGETALVFLHGWCGDRHYWKEQVDVFAPKYRVIAYDQAGHGESGKTRTNWRLGDLGGDVASVVNAFDLGRVILIGHSMGGPIALSAAKQLRGKVVAVVGVDTLQNAEFKMPEDTVSQLTTDLAADFKGMLSRTFTGLLPEQTDSALAQWLSNKAAAQDRSMATNLFREITAVDSRALMKEAGVPIRCINSAGGYQFFTPTSVETNRKYADFQAVFIENVGHYPMLEKPVEFNNELRAVLREFETR